MFVFSVLIFSFPQEGKIRFYFVAKNLKVLLLNILSKQLQTFSFTQRSFTKYCQLLQTISSSPSKYCFALYCRHLQKVTQSDFKKILPFEVCILIYFRSINFFSSKKFATNQHEEKKKPKPTKVFATFLEGSTIAFFFLFKRSSVFYDGMKSEANEMKNGRNI